MGCGFCTFGDPANPQLVRVVQSTTHNSTALPCICLTYSSLICSFHCHTNRNYLKMFGKQKKTQENKKNKQTKNNVLATTLIFGLVAKSLVVFVFFVFSRFCYLGQKQKTRENRKKVFSNYSDLCTSCQILVLFGFWWFWLLLVKQKTRENKKTCVSILSSLD